MPIVARRWSASRQGSPCWSRTRRRPRPFASPTGPCGCSASASLYAEAVRRGEKQPSLDAIDVPENRSWCPFQLAFILLNLPASPTSIIPTAAIRAEAIADLLWFPTGGGKTEAYLGLAAYTMALRRLQGTSAGRSGEHGVAVLMRYTLRLLTLQQFQRATALICACEMIRREDRRRHAGARRRSASACGSASAATPNWTEQTRRSHQARPRRLDQDVGGGSRHARSADQLPVVRQRRSSPGRTSRSRRTSTGAAGR